MSRCEGEVLNAKYIYYWSSQSMNIFLLWFLIGDPKQIVPQYPSEEKMELINLLEQKIKYIFKEVLDFIGVLSPFKFTENPRRITH